MAVTRPFLGCNASDSSPQEPPFVFTFPRKRIRQAGMTRLADTHLNCCKLSLGDPKETVPNVLLESSCIFNRTLLKRDRMSFTN